MLVLVTYALFVAHCEYSLLAPFFTVACLQYF